MYLKTEGVVLKHSNFAEADRLLVIYTRDFGKVTCIAKGARRPRSRKAGHVELGNWCRVFIAKGKNLDILTEVEIKKAFGQVDFTEDKANQIYHLLELVDSLTANNQKNEKVFNLLVNYLSKITGEEDFNLVSAVFKTKLLSQLGFFSARSLKGSQTKDFLQSLEVENYSSIKTSTDLKQVQYLKLSSFLDSIIENVTQSKIKTARFING